MLVNSPQVLASQFTDQLGSLRPPWSRPNRCSLAAARCGLQQRHALLVGTIVPPGSSKVDDGWMEERASQASTPVIIFF